VKIYIIVVLVALCGMFYVSKSFGHTHPGQYSQYTPDQQQWIRGQKVPEGNGSYSGTSCCSTIDAEEVQEDIRDGHYWIKGTESSDPTKPTLYQQYRNSGRIEGMDANGWVPVADSKVIHDANKIGSPIVYWGTSDARTLIVRCYAPGALF